MIAGASNRDSDFFEAVVTVIRMSSSSVMRGQIDRRRRPGVGRGPASGRAGQERAGKTDPHQHEPGIHG